MSTALWVFLFIVDTVVCFTAGVIYGAGKIDQYYGKAARETSNEIADLSKENAQLRTDLTRWQNGRLTSS